MTFRSRVLDALNIEKRSIKLPVKEVFGGQQYVVSKSKMFPDSVVTDPMAESLSGYAFDDRVVWSVNASNGNIEATLTGRDDVPAPNEPTGVYSLESLANSGAAPNFTFDGSSHTLSAPFQAGTIYEVRYVGNAANAGTDIMLSGYKTAGFGKKYAIGGGHCQTLDYLGFVVGKPLSAIELAAAQDSGHLDDGPASKQKPYPADTSGAISTGFHYLGGIYDDGNKRLQAMRKSAITPEEYRTGPDDEKNWPSDHMEQCRLLTDDPMADSLIYHQTRLSFLITGIKRPDSEIMGAASNHRGLVRCIVFRPLIPTAKLHMNSVNGKPSIRTDYLPNIDTELFYSGKKLLGGRMDSDIDFDNNDFAQEAVTFGLDKFDTVDPTLNLDTDSIYYGKPVPLPDSAQGTHRLSPFDLITAPINRKKYKVIVDKTFHLDTQHHGVASMRTEHITIPYNMQAKFAGRIPEVSDNVQTGHLTDNTFNEPLNMKSKPIIMFLSLDQTLSVQPTGYTVISEA